MPGIAGTSLCIVGEMCVEFHGFLPDVEIDPAYRDRSKTSVMLRALEVDVGGCALFGAVAALSLGSPFELIAHVGSEYPFSALHPANGGLLEEVLDTASGVTLAVEGPSGCFFSFWRHDLSGRVLYGKPGQGLRAADLEGAEIRAERVVLLSQADPGVYSTVRQLGGDEQEPLVVCAPNQALARDRATLVDYLCWGDILVINRLEGELYFGPEPERGVLATADRNAVVVITAADGDVRIVAPDGSCASVRIPSKATSALLGAGDAFTVAIACLWDRTTSLAAAIGGAARTAQRIQARLRPRADLSMYDR